MKINGQKTPAKAFAFDGCHKIYLCDRSEDEKAAVEAGYEVHPISELPAVYDCSCGLRFVSNWALDKDYVAQFEDAVFTN
jgi:uncharacterized ParB-like nuclease family protein